MRAHAVAAVLAGDVARLAMDGPPYEGAATASAGATYRPSASPDV